VKLEFEYRVEEIGGALRGAKADDLEAMLNELTMEGWEPVTVTARGSSSNQLLVVLRRQVGRGSRDRSSTWP
jgi:hypothetical protein